MERIKTIQPADWEHPINFDAGINQIVLSDTLDERQKKGSRIRLVRFNPGATTHVPFVHDYHEEVFIVHGDQVLLDKEHLRPIVKHVSGTYFERPAGTVHGPFESQGGCILLEVHYY